MCYKTIAAQIRIQLNSNNPFKSLSYLNHFVSLFADNKYFESVLIVDSIEKAFSFYSHYKAGDYTNILSVVCRKDRFEGTHCQNHSSKTRTHFLKKTEMTQKSELLSVLHRYSVKPTSIPIYDFKGYTDAYVLCRLPEQAFKGFLDIKEYKKENQQYLKFLDPNNTLNKGAN